MATRELALPVAWLMTLLLRGRTVGELYVLLVYSYAQLALLQTVFYALGAANSAAGFAASRFGSAVLFAWVFAGYFDWRPVRAVVAGFVVYTTLSVGLIGLGSLLIFAHRLLG